MGALVKRKTDRESKIDKMVADSQVDVGQRLRLVAEQSRHAQLAIKRRALGTAQRAMDVLIELMNDTSAPAQSRRLAALDILGLAGALPGNSEANMLAGKPVVDMTAAELREVLAEHRAKAADLQSQLIEGEAVEIATA